MAKVAEDAAQELPLDDERIEVPKKMSRHVTIALNHLNKQRDKALTRRAAAEEELKSIDAAIAALEA